LIKQRKVAALAVSTPFRLNELPDVPTLAQAGYPVAAYLFWCGLSAPANTPLVDKLNRAIGNVLLDPGIERRFWQMGVSPMAMKPEQYGKFFADDVAAMVKLGNDAHIAPSD
jgi:tripartite-type tricarboxylate transporter receptor subunit TctC